MPESMTPTQADLYQLYTYARGYDCSMVALVYPRSQNFRANLKYRLPDGITLLCLPFDIAHPQESVQHSITALTNA